MGGTSKNEQTQSSTNTGYAPAMTGVNGILSGINSLIPNAGLTPAQSAAISTLTANGQAGDPNAAGSVAGVKGLLNGGGANDNNAAILDNLTSYKGLLAPFANGSQVGANSALKPLLDQNASDITSQVNAQFAAAGRDSSPGNLQALGRGIAQGNAPIIAGQYNTDVGNQLNAANSIYGAGNTTYGLLNANNAAANSNIATGIQADPMAYNSTNAGANNVLQAQSMLYGLPLSQFTTALGAISPVAQAFGTQTGTGNGSNTMSGAQQFATIAGGIGSLIPKNPLTFNFS